MLARIGYNGLRIIIRILGGSLLEMAKLGRIILILASTAGLVWGQGAWLDEVPVRNWNLPGAKVPLLTTADPRGSPTECNEPQKPPQTHAERLVIQAGWRAVAETHRKDGTTVVFGRGGTDGMCRFEDFQLFIFVNDRFAGTVSPSSMYSRLDGEGWVTSIARGQITAAFKRYRDGDPSCCHSGGTTEILYEIGTVADNALVIPVKASTKAIIPKPPQTWSRESNEVQSPVAPQKPVPMIVKVAFGQIVVRAGGWVPYRVVIAENMREAHLVGSFSAAGGTGNDIAPVVAEEVAFRNWINGHEAQVFYSPGKRTADRFDIRLPPGTYVLAFANKFSAITDKVVSLNVELRYSAPGPR